MVRVDGELSAGLLERAGRDQAARVSLRPGHRDCERDPATSEAMIRWAAINTMTSRIARGEPATRQQRWHWPGESCRVSATR